MIPFSKSSITELEKKYILDSLENNTFLSGDGKYTKRVCEQFKKRFSIDNLCLTTSGTMALEMASLLINLKPGDEVIMPSFTFSSTANAVALRGATPVFCDIRKDTMNIDEHKIEALITSSTKAIYPVDYAGVPCEINPINDLAKQNNLHVVVDAAQSVGSTYYGKFAGTLSEIGCYSFHDTKNYTMGEGGAVVLNDPSYIKRAEIIREKGTNRQEVISGVVDKYTWHDIGSSYLPSDILAALLCAQMERFDEIMEKRMNIWNIYHHELLELENKEMLERQYIPTHITHNAHMYFVILNNSETRARLIDYLKKQEISAYFHYIPLHNSPMGLKFGSQTLPLTEDYSSRLLRLPLYTDMSEEDAKKVISSIRNFLINKVYGNEKHI